MADIEFGGDENEIKPTVADVYQAAGLELDAVADSLESPTFTLDASRGDLSTGVTILQARMQRIASAFRMHFDRKGYALQLLRSDLLCLLTKFNDVVTHVVVRGSEKNSSASALPLMSSSIEGIIRQIDKLDQEVPTTPMNLQSFKVLVPDQKIAPLQFKIVFDRIFVAEQHATPNVEDSANVEISRTALLAGGERVLDELRRSNCDRRLLDSVAELQRDLGAQVGIIQLGILNISCEAVCAAFEKELPDALRGLLLGHTRGISMYVAQFPDWQRFSENAAAAEFGGDDVRLVFATARRLVMELEAHDEIADPEVPASIKALLDLVSDPAQATKRAAFAMLRTIENLVAKAIQFGIELLEDTAEKTKNGLSSVASTVIIGTVLTLALNGALGISPLAGKVPDAAWVKAAVEFVERQIEALTH